MKTLEADSIIFDLDGTLWDSLEGLTRAWDYIATEHGFPGVFTKDAMRELMGFTEKDILEKYEKVFGDSNCNLVADLLDRGDGCLTPDGIRFYEGLNETLNELSSRKPLFLVSNCKTGYMEKFLELSGCRDCFRRCICEGTYGLPKAENIARIIEEYGLKSPVYVGDTLKDERSARACGASFIYASYGFGQAENPDFIIKNPAELCKIIE